MEKDTLKDQGQDSTQELTVKIPRRLAERVRDYAQEANNTIEGVVIEALDRFMLGWQDRRKGG